MEAEQSVLYNGQNSLILFNKAIESANKNGYLRYEALANEHAANFCQ